MAELPNVGVGGSAAEALEELKRQLGLEAPGVIKSYAEFVAAARAPYEEARQAAVVQTRAEEAFGSPTYGAAGERLGRAGMAGGGYAAAVKAALSEKTSLDVARAEDLSEEKLRADYKTYVEQEQKKRVSLQKDCLSKMLRAKFTSYTKALQFAMDYGLTEKEAKDAARMAIAMGEAAASEADRNLRVTALNKMISYGLPKEYGALLGMAYGLSQKDAEELAALAQTIHWKRNSSANKSYPYSDYLSNMAGEHEFLKGVDMEVIEGYLNGEWEE